MLLEKKEVVELLNSIEVDYKIVSEIIKGKKDRFEVYTEDEMEEDFISRGVNVLQEEDENSFIVDSSLVFEEASNLGYTSILDEKAQTYIFIKGVA